MPDFLRLQVAGNEVWRLGVFFGILLLCLSVGRLARFFIERYTSKSDMAQKRVTTVLLRSLGRALVLLGVALGFYLAMLALTVTPKIQDVLSTICRVINSAAFGYAVYCFVDVVDFYLVKVADRTASKVDDMLVPLVGRSVRITILLVIVLQVVQALSDKPITSIVASLGVGGLAVALAGQDTIKNFFGSLVIVADKPFEIGDRIVVDGHDGPVESVGFRSTRVRTLDGHLITVPNAEMANKTVKNISKRPFIKRVANITVTYDTSPEKMDRAIGIIKEILDDHEGMDSEFPPRVFFNDFNDWALNILVIYWYHPPDYWKYMEFTQSVNREILRRFNEEKIEFAFPSQTIYFAGKSPGVSMNGSSPGP